MIIEKIEDLDAWLVYPTRHQDSRGWFQEQMRKDLFTEQTGFSCDFVQINISHSTKDVFRGIHYSASELGQSKFVSVVNGVIDDYVVDLRMKSASFRKAVRLQLDDKLNRSVLIGPHMGHAFRVRSETATVCYGVTAYFDPATERTLNPFCSRIGLEIHDRGSLILSERDRDAPDLETLIQTGNLPVK